MEHIHNNLMILGGSLGNVPQKFKKAKTCYKNSINFGLLVHFQEYNLYIILVHINYTLENGLIA
jgi:hypothetical protein